MESAANATEASENIIFEWTTPELVYIVVASTETANSHGDESQSGTSPFAATS